MKNVPVEALGATRYLPPLSRPLKHRSDSDRRVKIRGNVRFRSRDRPESKHMYILGKLILRAKVQLFFLTNFKNGGKDQAQL